MASTNASACHRKQMPIQAVQDGHVDTARRGHPLGVGMQIVPARVMPTST
ncbi:hypothetical protein [Actinophytocola glycyrrhizae]|uniref:Uncharacterized protein n=1 Tax=Actinophytocola glycyrrhizae TaxID=2044873 RepID=A0ABV9SAX2_9PSEU